MAAVESLMLDHNPMVVEVLDHFKDRISATSNNADKAVLHFFQTPAIVYACQGVKRNGGTIDVKTRAAAVREAYKDVVVPGFLKWLDEEASFTTPPWLTMNMMGSSTKSSGEAKLYSNGNRVWSKHQEAMRIMRKNYNAAYDEVTSGQPEGQPRSGQQYADQLEEFLDKLWEMQCKDKDKVSDVVNVTGDQSEQAGGGATPARSTPPSTTRGGSPEESQRDRSERVAGEASSAETTDNAEAAAETSGTPPAKNSVDVDEERGSSGDPSSSSTPASSERPDGWIPKYILAFCLFVRPSKSEDVDLKCKAGSGPPNRGQTTGRGKGKGKSSASGSLSGEEDDFLVDGVGAEDQTSRPAKRLSRAGLTQFVGAGEAQSKAKVKKAQAKVESREAADEKHKDMMELLKEQAEHSKILSKALTKVAEVERERERREQEQERREQERECRQRKENEIADVKGELAITKGNTARYVELKKKLAALHTRPLSRWAQSSTASAQQPTSPPSVTTRSVPPVSGGLPLTPPPIIMPGFQSSGSEASAVGAGGGRSEVHDTGGSSGGVAGGPVTRL